MFSSEIHNIPKQAEWVGQSRQQNSWYHYEYAFAFGLSEEKIYKHIEGSGPEWYISSMLYSQDIAFWSGTLDIFTPLSCDYTALVMCPLSVCYSLVAAHCWLKLQWLIQIISIIWFLGVQRVVHLRCLCLVIVNIVQFSLYRPCCQLL